MTDQTQHGMLDESATTPKSSATPIGTEDVLRRIRELHDELRELRARIPQSDWHMAFEVFLRIVAFGLTGVEVKAEVEIGAAPPRADFVVVQKDDDATLPGYVFSSFRRVNVLEYKRPNDDLNLRTVAKALGYAAMLFGTGDEESAPRGQVTVTLFRAKFAPGLMKSLGEEGASVDNTAPGVYDVGGFSPIPLRIVTTSQLEGDEYAPLRALSEEANPEDAKAVSTAFEASTGEVHELWKKYLDHVVEKNLSVFESLVKKDGEEDSIVSDAIMELVEDKVKERERAAAHAAATAATEAATTATNVKNIRSLMETTGWSADLAMSALKVPEREWAHYTTLVTMAPNS